MFHDTADVDEIEVPDSLSRPDVPIHRRTAQQGRQHTLALDFERRLGPSHAYDGVSRDGGMESSCNQMARTNRLQPARFAAGRDDGSWIATEFRHQAGSPSVRTSPATGPSPDEPFRPKKLVAGLMVATDAGNRFGRCRPG